MDKEPELTDPDQYYGRYYGGEIPKKGICLQCLEIKEGLYCNQCGKQIKRNCEKCKDVLISDADKDVPKFCKSCGEDIREKKSA